MKEGLDQFKYIMDVRQRVIEAREVAGIPPLVRTGKTKKIIGLSFGKKNGLSDTYLKGAALGAEELGMEVELVRVSDFTVKPCRGCYACLSVFAPKPTIPKCPIKDDVSWLMEKAVIEDASLIVSVPVYHLLSNALLLTLCQRMHPTMFTHLEMLESSQRKVAGIISLGGGVDGWTSLGFVAPKIWLQHFSVLADQMQVETRARDVDWFERARQLGRNVAHAMTMPIEQVRFMGEESSFSCPVCHSDVLQMPDHKARPMKQGEYRWKPSHVVCPICWVHGDLYFEGDTLKVKWDEWDVEHSRFSEYGDLEHLDILIRNVTPGADLFNPVYAHSEGELVEQYKTYGKFVKPS